MDQYFDQTDMLLKLDGMGIVLYSPGAMEWVAPGYDFFDEEFNDAEQVARHLQKGDIIGFNTGTGDFMLKFRSGYPDNSINQQFPVQIELGLEVKGGCIYAMDLFWIMDWEDDCPAEQQLHAEDGFYHLTVCTRRPDSGFWGDNQDIYIYMNRVIKLPELNWQGVPQLFE